MTRYDTHFVSQTLPSKVFYRFGRLIMSGGIRVYTRMSIIGRENLPATGAYVLSPVHRSYIDTPISGALTTRRLRFLGKDSMWSSKWFGWVLSSLGAIPVTRGSADREAMKRAVNVLEAGEPLVLYPEGERKSGPVVQPMFDGAVYIALKAGVPIIPVGIGGSERVMPKSAKFIYPRKVRVVIGEALYPNVPVGEGSRVPRSAIAAQSAALHAELQRLFDMSMVGVGWSYPPESAHDQNATND